MRHGKKFNHLGRTSSHRKALLRNMAISLIEHKRITTTVAKAKELRKFVEPLVTKARSANSASKEQASHLRRVVFSYLQNKEAARELFEEVIPQIGERPGGYTRILKLGNRAGDNAEMAFIEFVDFNELAPGKVAEEGSSSRRRRRRRRGKKGGGSAAENVAQQQEETAAAVAAETAEAAIEEAEVVEEAVAEQPIVDELAETASEDDVASTEDAGDQPAAEEDDKNKNAE